MAYSVRVDDKIIRLNGRIPLLPLRDVVIFPRMNLPLFVGRPQSVAAIERAAAGSKWVFACTQRRPEVFAPSQGDLYDVGTLVRLLQVFRLPDGTMRILVEGISRARLARLDATDGWLDAELGNCREESEPGGDAMELLRPVQNLFAEYAQISQRVPEDALSAALAETDPGRAADLMSAQLLLKVSARQELLEALDPMQRLNALASFLSTELEILRLERKIEREGHLAMGRARRREDSGPPRPARSRREPPPDADGDSEFDELEQKIKATRMPKAVEEKARRELDRLGKMAALSPEATVARTYLEWLTSVPWRKQTKDRIDLVEAERLLDADHFGLTKVKERIVEHLAVMKLSKKVRGPVLCLIGPPGVGKTSLGRSIAQALNRRFVRMSLGGVRDEAEIRGHRRTYIGSMPGRIIQAMRKAGTMNPVILLDEIDKLGTDFRGDPASALLEVLDPEQNGSFNDHYLEVDYDLSRVLFLTTANLSTGIPPALQDRMEVIRIPGYLETEKQEIAKRFLLPRQLTGHGLAATEVVLEEPAIQRVLREYTREAGVRNLERSLASICRKVARQKAAGELNDLRTVTATELDTLLGPPRFTDNPIERRGRVGVATGLAWTEAGGEILIIESRVLPGRGRLILTGKLGETMRESAQAALSYIRSRATELGIDPNFYREQDLHVHVPEGGVPKDGPSAGAAIALSIVSALTGVPTRASVALTGEITLRGRVLAIGGLPEKAVAAYRAGIRTLLIPAQNTQSLVEVPAEVREKMRIVPVSGMNQVLRRGLLSLSGERRDLANKKGANRLVA
ncbi:MAG: endopeptidase La [Candidatus Eisenbacteria bacterium]|nr:endopeptidase La [Candidatus Eisenbacteria bacterium]